MLKDIQAVVFDLDNTLVSSSLNFSLIRQELGCDSGQDLLKFVEAMPEAQKRSATQRIVSHELQDAQTAYALEGCHTLLDKLEVLNLKTAIVTRNCKQAADLKVNNNNLNIPIVLTREDHAAKPDPAALLHLADKWRLDTQQILYVGDYLYDLQTAINADTKSCLVSFSKQHDFAHLADLVVNDLKELTENLSAVHGENLT